MDLSSNAGTSAESRPHGFVQSVGVAGLWQWICGWCGTHAQGISSRSNVRAGLHAHLAEEHGVDSHEAQALGMQ